MKDVMTENSSPNFKEAEELNKKLDDAASAIPLLMKNYLVIIETKQKIRITLSRLKKEKEKDSILDSRRFPVLGGVKLFYDTGRKI